MQILLVDDHRMMLAGLRFILQREGLNVIAEATNGREAVKKVGELRPDIVLMDITMPQMNGIEATRQITSNYPETHVIGLSAHSDRHYLLEMLDAGVAGFVLKDSVADEIVRAIQCVGTQRKYLSPDVTDTVVEGYLNRDRSGEASTREHLGSREREVLQLIAEGYKSSDIADKMDISTSTVETHRRNVMKKLGLRSIAALTKYAVRHGLTAP